MSAAGFLTSPRALTTVSSSAGLSPKTTPLAAMALRGAGALGSKLFALREGAWPDQEGDIAMVSRPARFSRRGGFRGTIDRGLCNVPSCSQCFFG